MQNKLKIYFKNFLYLVVSFFSSSYNNNIVIEFYTMMVQDEIEKREKRQKE